MALLSTQWWWLGVAASEVLRSSKTLIFRRRGRGRPERGPRTFRSHCARVQRIFGHLTGPHQQCCNSQSGWFRGIPSHLGAPKGYICFMHVPCMDSAPKSHHLSTFMFPPSGWSVWALQCQINIQVAKYNSMAHAT